MWTTAGLLKTQKLRSVYIGRRKSNDDIDMLISNGENKGSKLICETGPLRQGKEYRRGISQLTRKTVVGEKKRKRKVENTREK